MLSDKLFAFVKSLFWNHRLRWHQDNLVFFDGCQTILDLGSGKGLFVQLDPERIIPFDWTFNSLCAIKDHGLRVLGSVVKLPFRDVSFDGVYCADVIEHFAPKEAREILAESIRVLKQGGRLVIATPYPSQEFWCDPTHVRPYPPESLLSYCTDDAGKGQGTNPSFPSFLAGLKAIALRQRRRPLVNLPLTLYFDEDRKKLSRLLDPRSLFFMASNVAARFGILNPKPEGYVLVLEKG